MSIIKQSKIAFADVETTGLNPYLNAIHQLSVIIESDGEVVEKLDFRIRPFYHAKIDQIALDKGGVTEEDLTKYDDHKEVFKIFKKTLGKYVDPYKKTDKYDFVAYNSPFDNEFIRQWFNRNGDTYFGSWFWNPDICVMRLVAFWMKLKKIDRPVNMKLIQVSNLLGFTKSPDDDDKWHDSMFDIEMTRRVYNHVKNDLLRS